MKPKQQRETPDLFRSRLDQILNQRHPFFVLANQIDWSVFEEHFGQTYDEKNGRPGCPIRLMVGLHYLKYAFNESDESVVARFLENPYWQYFCGCEYFQHHLPIDSSSLTRFRKRVGSSGFEQLFKETVETAKRGNHLTRSHLNKVNIDTTVQEKAIAYPTDARLYYKMRAALVRAAEARNIELRQSYKRVAKIALAKQGRYSHAKQPRRSQRETRRLKTMLGCVYRDILRKTKRPDKELKILLQRADRILKQKRDDKKKLYSVYAPEVECISKGKVHKRYEFGCKVGLATTSRDNWIVGVQAFHDNPYDGHTLPACLHETKRYTGWHAKEAYVDLGYRGHLYHGKDTQVHIVDFRHMKRKTRAVKYWFKRRAAIEPVFGHLKSDNRMSKNYLRGAKGDQINALLCACGFNLRKLLAVFFLPNFLMRYFQRTIEVFISFRAVFEDRPVRFCEN
jgi:IS5 family transposase